jgi:transcriptional regulator with XRE-family HTH domain
MTKPSLNSNNFSMAMRLVRKAQGVTQEEFALVSSRTYVSSVERGLKVPTLSKIDALAEVLGVHPLTLLTIAYVRNQTISDTLNLLGAVENEIDEIYSKLKAVK